MRGFYRLQFNGMATEMWKCDVCDRLMVFDDPRSPAALPRQAPLPELCITFDLAFDRVIHRGRLLQLA